MERAQCAVRPARGLRHHHLVLGDEGEAEVIGAAKCDEVIMLGPW
jgi:hypothetical protein